MDTYVILRRQGWRTSDDLQQAAARSKQVTDKDMKEMIPMLQLMAPKNLQITGGAIDGDHATLLATSQDGSDVMNGTITMAKENGAWKVEQESWKN